MLELKRGVNLGGFLSQCTYDTAHYESFLTREDIRRIAEMKFDHVRLPVDYEVIETEEGEEISAHYRFIDDTIAACREEGLKLVLDVHRTWGYTYTKAAEAGSNTLFDSKEARDRFCKLWKKLSKRYGAAYDMVAFELLNEVVNPEYAKPWNELIDRVVKVIRADAPHSTIIYGGVEWNSAGTLKYLNAPADENTIFTFHYYEPLVFTHQKAYWVPTIRQDLSVDYLADMEYLKRESARIGLQGMSCANAASDVMGLPFHEEMIGDAIRAVKERGVPLYCGEFGVIDRADAKQAMLWYRDVLTMFDRYGIGYAVWSYKEMDFGIMGEQYAPVREFLQQVNETGL